MSLLHDIHDTAMQIRELCNKLDSEISDIGLDVEKKQTKDENIGALMLNTRGRCYPIRNHFMKESEGTQSYILLLVFVFLLLQKYAVRSEEGIQFIERIRRSIGIRESLEALIAAEVSGGNIAVDQWIQDVKEAGAESVFAVDAILLYDQMQAGGKRLEQLVRILSLLGCDEELVNEAAEAAMYIEKGDWISLFRAGQNWEQVNSDLLKDISQRKN